MPGAVFDSSSLIDAPYSHVSLVGRFADSAIDIQRVCRSRTSPETNLSRLTEEEPCLLSKAEAELNENCDRNSYRQ